MRILLVDNGTQHLLELVTLLQGYEVTTLAWEQLASMDTAGFDVVVLSGGGGPSVVGHEEVYRYELDLIKNASKPIIGICLGYELIAQAFGSTLQQLEKKESGLLNIELLRPHPFFLNVFDPQVYEGHRWVVSEVKAPLVALAKSKDGYEIVAHMDRPIYGFQFHPEMCVDTTMGDEMLKNCLTFIESSL